MPKYLTKSEVKALLDKRPPEKRKDALNALVQGGYTLEGYNDNQSSAQSSSPQVMPAKEVKSMLQSGYMPQGKSLKSGGSLSDLRKGREIDLMGLQDPLKSQSYSSERIAQNSQNLAENAASFLTESTLKPVAKGALTASVGPLVAGIKSLSGGKINEPIDVYGLGNINPNANTALQQLGIAGDFGLGGANLLAPYKSALGAGLRGGAQSVAKEAAYNPNADQNDLLLSGALGGGLSALLSPQALKALKSKAGDQAKNLYSKIIQSTDKQKNSGIDLAQELMDRGLSGSNKSLVKKVTNIKNVATSARKDLFSKSQDIVETKDIINEIENYSKTLQLAPGTKQQFNNLKDRIIADIKSEGKKLSLDKTTQLKSALQKQAKSAFGTEGSQGKELYKAASNAVKKLAEKADSTKQLQKLNKDIRFGITALPKLEKALAKAADRKFVSFGDAMVTAPGAAIGSLAGGVPGAAIGSIVAPIARQAINSTSVKSATAKTLAKLAKSSIQGDKRSIVAQPIVQNLNSLIRLMQGK